MFLLILNCYKWTIKLLNVEVLLSHSECLEDHSKDTSVHVVHSPVASLVPIPRSWP